MKKSKEELFEIAESSLVKGRKNDFEAYEHHFKQLAMMWNLYLNSAHSNAKEKSFEITSKDAAIMLTFIKELRSACGDVFVEYWTKGINARYEAPIEEIYEMCRVFSGEVYSNSA